MIYEILQQKSELSCRYFSFICLTSGKDENGNQSWNFPHFRQVETVSVTAVNGMRETQRSHDSSFAVGTANVKHRQTCVNARAMANISAISRVFVKLNKNIVSLGISLRHGRRLYSKKTREESVPLLSWSINGTNSPYSSVNATLVLQKKSFAFNCGEGFQRITDEVPDLRLGTITHIFFTRLDWRCVAGLPGLVLTLNDRKGQHLNVFGPSKLKHLCDGIMKNMSTDKGGLAVTSINCDMGHTYTESKFGIRAIPLRNPSEDYAKVIAYAANFAAHRSWIKIEKCVDLNVPAGPLITQLANGLDVTLDDGSVVRAADVVDSYPKLNFLSNY